jgi:CRP-like cAMP-binding protein
MEPKMAKTRAGSTKAAARRVVPRRARAVENEEVRGIGLQGRRNSIARTSSFSTALALLGTTLLAAAFVLPALVFAIFGSIARERQLKHKVVCWSFHFLYH